MTIVVLIGGGGSSGKLTYSHTIREKILEQVPMTKIKEINLEEQYYDGELPLNADKYRFEQLIKDLDVLEEDVVIVYGIYLLYNQLVRLKASLKLFVDCDNDTRLTRSIQKNPLSTNAELSKIISNHLMTRSDLIGRTDSDIVIKTDEKKDESKNLISVELIMNYLKDLLSDNGVDIADKGEINLRDNFDRFYELN